MANATISARVDAEDKRRFDEFCGNIGLTSSALMNAFVKQVIRLNRVPFELSADPFYSERNMAFLREGVAQLNAGKGTEHELIEADGHKR